MDFASILGRLAIIVGALVAIGCGGSSGGGNSGSETPTTVNGLETPATMSVVTSQAQAQGQSFGSLQQVTGLVANPLPGAGSDYASDKQNVYVFDESMESMQTVNMILCLMAQTRAADMVNQGAYLALVDEDKCEQGQNQSSAGATGQSSGGQAAALSKWTIVSTRADNNSPQLVKIWVPGQADDREGGNILVELTVTEGKSAAKPYGSFVLNFKGVGDTGLLQGGSPSGNYIDLMQGSLFTVASGGSASQFKFINLSGSEIAGSPISDFGRREAANVVLNDGSGASGRARALRSETGDFDGPGPQGITTEAASYTLDFNSANVLRAKDVDSDNVADAQKCLSRSNFNSQAWRYNLYDATSGARVALNSGFPFVYAGQYGHVGYFGVWYEGGNLPDGATIAKMDYASNTSTAYTVRVAPGKLVKRTANTLALSELQGAELYYFGDVGGDLGQYLVTVNGSNQFIATDSVVWGNGGRTTTPITPTDITPANNTMLGLWSDALGGNVNYVGGGTSVVFYAQEFVQPNDAAFTGGAVTLNCYQRCLKGGLTQADVDAAAGNQSALYYADKFNPGDVPYAYSVDVVGGKLRVRDHLGNAVSAAALDLSSLGHDWGISTGEMITGTVANPWEVYGAAVSYRYETGSNNWNQQVTVQRASDSSYVAFDRPLQFNYTFAAGDNRNPNETAQVGKKFMLQYGGPGELWGFPWEQDANNPNRWRSAVTLKDGVLLNDGSSNYIVKAIELEESMQLANVNDATDLSACTGASLDAASLFSNAAMALPSAGDIGTVSITLADKPVVTAAPAVINGELQ
jgi:hypothetical protein